MNGSRSVPEALFDTRLAIFGFMVDNAKSLSVEQLRQLRDIATGKFTLSEQQGPSEFKPHLILVHGEKPSCAA